MKTVEHIQNEIKRLEHENELNWDRKDHFTKSAEWDRVEEYTNMILKNDSRIEVLKWVLND